MPQEKKSKQSLKKLEGGKKDEDIVLARLFNFVFCADDETKEELKQKENTERRKRIKSVSGEER